jgi:hypothetical protein
MCILQFITTTLAREFHFWNHFEFFKKNCILRQGFQFHYNGLDILYIHFLITKEKGLNLKVN